MGCAFAFILLRKGTSTPHKGVTKGVTMCGGFFYLENIRMVSLEEALAFTPA